MTNNSDDRSQLDLTPTYLLTADDFKKISRYSFPIKALFALGFFIFAAVLSILSEVSLILRCIVLLKTLFVLTCFFNVPKHWRNTDPRDEYIIWSLLNILNCVPLLYAPASLSGHFLFTNFLFFLLNFAFSWELSSLFRAGIYQLTRDIRHDRLISQSTQFRRPQFWINRFPYRLRRFVSLRNWQLWCAINLLVGGLFVPIFLHIIVNESRVNTGEPKNARLDSLESQVISYWIETILKDISWSLSPLELMTIGIFTTVLLLIIYGGWVAIRYRDKYVVSDFRYSGDQNDSPDIESMALLARRLLIQELQSMGTLLRHRQIRNVNISREDANAFFVSSGLDKEFLKDLEQIGSVEIGGSGRFNIGLIPNIFLRSAARIYITGSVHLSKEGNANITASIRMRNRMSHAESKTFLLSSQTLSLEEDDLRPHIRTIALNLIVASQQVSGIGNSPDALDHFLRGLNASAMQNWWQAISHYYKALDLVKGQNASIGIIYFHLGSALTFQGRWDEGYRMLKRSEEHGPQLPETQYMLALVALYTYWGEIHNTETVTKEIEYRCRQALQMRSQFPEAHQLLGILHYRRGRTLDRDQGSAKSKVNQDVEKEYKLATREFQKALAQYDHELARLQKQAWQDGLNESHLEQIARQRIVTAHQIADCLRGRKLYAEAEQYYLDMQAILPTNIRNIADLLKTYTNANLWQRSQEILYRVALRQEAARWDADIHIHAAWLLAGGANVSNNNKRDLVAKAFGYLDYAIYVRPRYVRDWRQTGAIGALLESIGTDSYPSIPDSFSYASDSQVIHDRNIYLAFLCLRLSNVETRNDSLLKSNTMRILFTELEEKLSVSKKGGQAQPTTISSFKKARDKFIEIRDRIVQDEIGSINISRVGGLQRTFKQIEQVAELSDLWTQTNKLLIEDLKQQKNWLNPVGRLKLDIYLHISMLTARMMAHVDMHDELLKLAKDVCEHLEAFVGEWRNRYKYTAQADDNSNPRTHYTLTPYVFRFQRATMLGWAAFANLQILSNHSDHVSNYERLFEAKKYHTDAIRDLVSVHPLVMLTRAHMLAHEKLFPEAVEELKKLLDVIDPFDPKQDVGRIAREHKPNPTSDDTRNWLYHVERVMGRQQFHKLVNPTSIHCLISKYSLATGEHDTAVRHLNEAIRLSTFSDRDLDVLIDLAEKLISMSNYDDALSVISAARTPREKLIGMSLSEAKRRMPDVLEALVLTRQFRHPEALAKSQDIAKSFNLIILDQMSDIVKKAYPNDTNFSEAFKNYTDKNRNTLKTERKTRDKRLEAIFQIEGQTSFKYSSFSKGLNELLKMCGVEKDPSNENQDIIFPKVFHRLVAKGGNYSTTLDLSSQLASVYLNMSGNNTTGNDATNINVDQDSLKQKSLLMFHAREATESLFQISEICNLLAYNRIETGAVYGNYHAFVDVLTAIFIISHLLEISAPNHPKRDDYSAKLAQYCDTLGWLLFRSHSHIPQKFKQRSQQPFDFHEQAKHFLKTSIRYDHTKAIPHYHLAMVCIDQLEKMMNNYSRKTLADAKLIIDEANVAMDTAMLNDQYSHLRLQNKELFHRLKQVEKLYN